MFVLYLNHFLFVVFFLLRILNFDVARNMFLFVLLSPARSPVKSPPRLLFQARFFILKITFCLSPLSYFHSWRTEKKIVYEHTNNGGGRSGRENKHKSKRVKKNFSLFFCFITLSENF